MFSTNRLNKQTEEHWLPLEYRPPTQRPKTLTSFYRERRTCGRREEIRSWRWMTGLWPEIIFKIIWANQKRYETIALKEVHFLTFK